MKLTQLNCYITPVSDLSPLKDMKLTEELNMRLHGGVRPVAAEGHAAETVYCSGAQVSDLSPLKGMPWR